MTDNNNPEYDDERKLLLRMEKLSKLNFERKIA